MFFATINAGLHNEKMADHTDLWQISGGDSKSFAPLARRTSGGTSATSQPHVADVPYDVPDMCQPK